MVNQNEIIAFILGSLIGVGLAYIFFQLRRRDTQSTTETILSQVDFHIQAVSAEALRKNSEQFFSMARETLTNQVAAGEQDLLTQKQLIDQTLQAMKLELDDVQTLVTSLEKDREGKFGELTQQLKQAAEQTTNLQNTTEKLRLALSNTQTRGQWGERMAEDVLRTAGFIEGINYQKQ